MSLRQTGTAPRSRSWARTRSFRGRLSDITRLFHKMTPQQTKIALRINDDNINHHLWNNRGVWWCHVTVHKPDATAERLRFSLKTRDIKKARTLRDRIFADIQRHFGIAA